MGSVPTFGHVLNRRYNSVLIQDSWEWWGTRAFGAPSYRDAAAVGRFGEGWACKPSPSNLTASVRKCKNRPVGGFLYFLGGSGVRMARVHQCPPRSTIPLRNKEIRKVDVHRRPLLFAKIRLLFDS